MPRPSLPSWLSGTVPIQVPKVNIWLGLVCGVCAYVGQVFGPWWLLAVGVGGLIVMPLSIAFQWLGRARFLRMVAHWPSHVQVIERDGERIAVVTLAGGGMTTLPLPDGYDPTDDDGEWFLRQLAPDLAAQIFDAKSDETAE